MGTVYNKHVLVFTLLTKNVYYLYCSCLLSLSIHLRHQKKERIQYIYLLCVGNDAISEPPEALHPRSNPKIDYWCFPNGSYHILIGFCGCPLVNDMAFTPPSARWASVCSPKDTLTTPCVLQQHLNWQYLLSSDISYSLPTVW